MILAGVFYFVGFAGLYAGERLIGEGAGRLIASGIGGLSLAASLLLRGLELRKRADTRRGALVAAVIAEIIGVSSLALYALSAEGVARAMGLDEDGVARWQGPLSALWPLLWLFGTAPMVALDRLLRVHPKALPMGAVRQAVQQAVIVALSFSLLVPVNYLALQHEKSWDVALYRTTRVSESTAAVAQGLSAPLEIYLFYPAASDVKEELLPYFEQLVAESKGQVRVQVVDQALDPALAEEFKLRANGQIVLRQGERSEKIPVAEKMDRARKDLRKLDSLVQKHMLRLTREAQTVYWMVGHEEASAGDDDPLRKLSLFKKALEALHMKVKNFGLTEGSAQKVPEDADLIVLAAPRKELLPEELATLTAWLDQGGHLLVLLDTDATTPEGLLTHMGVSAGSAPMANTQAYVVATRGPADILYLSTNRFGSHAITKILSRYSSSVSVFLPTALPLNPLEGAKVSPLVRGMPGTFEDANGDLLRTDEPDSSASLAVAAEGSSADGEGWRAVVIGDAGLFSDTALRVSKGNGQLAIDAVRWLVGDEEIIGEAESEEDVMIQHTREEDVLWFYGTVFAVPILVLGFGMGLTALRRRNK